MSKTAFVGIMGFGTIGGGTYQILTSNHDLLLKNTGIDFKVKKILTKTLNKPRTLKIPENMLTINIDDIVNDKDISIVVETIGGIEPPKTYIEKVLLAGKNVVTANKELLAKYWPEVENAAKKGKSSLYIEASCVGGVPIIRAINDCLQANKINSLIGIVNGTTNYILSKMTDEDMSYSNALAEAQKLGYAERNPESDVEGFDATYKLSILSSLAFHTCIPYSSIYREGITKITKKDIKLGKDLGLIIKLLAIGKRKGNNIEVRVHPTFISKTHPLATVSGSFNAVFVNGDYVDDLMFYGRGAGARPTGSAVVSDVVFAAKQAYPIYSNFENTGKIEDGITISKDFISKYFISINEKNDCKILIKLTTIFSKYNIDIESFKHTSNDKEIENCYSFLTFPSKESDIEKCINEIENTLGKGKFGSLIRVL